MQRGATNTNETVIYMAAYRTKKEESAGLCLPEDREEVEEVFRQLAHHLLMAVRVISKHCH
ncbi:hypothetical protein J2803_005669 [Paraburkholderia phenoliruptrix]|nr:hypothetical protein [Paraburkholderia phenoliruptrix]